MKQIYLRYLVLAETLRKSSIDLSDIDEIGKKLLETIAIKSAQGQPMVVTQTMELSDIASPATIHRRIETLKKAGLIKVFQTEQNQKIIDLNSCNWEMSLLFTKIKHDMNTVSPEQLERRTNNYIQPTPPEPIQPISNNYQPVSSNSAAIETVQEPSEKPMKTEINEPTTQTETQVPTEPMITQPQIQTETPQITQIQPLETVENKDYNSIDMQNKQDIQHDNLYDLLYSLVQE